MCTLNPIQVQQRKRHIIKAWFRRLHPCPGVDHRRRERRRLSGRTGPYTLQVQIHLMETGGDIEGNLMLQETMPLGPIDPKRARFPCCIVWTPLPFISWLIPFIGHVGICREDGVILDFAGPNFVCVDHFTFGAVARYIQLDRKKVAAQDRQAISGEELTWDDALRKSTQEFQHRSYNLFTCNCHSFVANNLNRLCYGGRDNWNVVNLATWIFIKGTWVNKRALLKSFLPFLMVLGIGVLLGGSTFLSGLLLLSLALVSWFLLGTYCFKNLVQL